MRKEREQGSPWRGGRLDQEQGVWKVPRLGSYCTEVVFREDSSGQDAELAREGRPRTSA